MPGDTDDSVVHLDELLGPWLRTGHGTEATAANYDHFLQVVVCVVQDLLTGSASLDYLGGGKRRHTRRMAGLISPGDGNILSRMGYDHLVHQTLEIQRTREPRAALRRPSPVDGATRQLGVDRAPR
ncbi:hypothetical protein AB0910_03670 [Streptomyces sp. NPDC047002]|uniref:hypothetical protein n=1 Tax=Streptomyces sp. NPDC047002 TaxID=3155475 RepID=UPI0034556E29